MATLTYVITDRQGPFDSLTNPDKSSIQTAVRTWSFTASCNFHGSHNASVLDGYTTADVKTAIQNACVNAYKSAPEIGQTWSVTV